MNGIRSVAGAHLEERQVMIRSLKLADIVCAALLLMPALTMNIFAAEQLAGPANDPPQARRDAEPLVVEQAGAKSSESNTVAVAKSAELPGNQKAVFDLGEIVVTGLREGSALYNLSAINAREMRERDDKTLPDAVNHLPGVSVSRTGARNEGMINVRGFDLRQVPVFVDGIPRYVPYDGYADVNQFGVFGNSEVTVEKGFTSILYGPNTLGGAINVVTLRPTKPFEGAVGAGTEMDSHGKFPMAYEYLNAGGKDKYFYYQGNASCLNQKYTPLSHDFEPAQGDDGGKDRRANSYDSSLQYMGRVGFTPNDFDEYVLTYSGLDSSKGVPPYAGPYVAPPNKSPNQQLRYWQWPAWDMNSVYFNSKTRLSDTLVLKLRAFADQYRNSLNSYDDDLYRKMSKPSAFASAYDDDSYGGTLELDYDVTAVSVLKSALIYRDDIHRESGNQLPSAATWPRRLFEDYTLSLGSEYTHTLWERLEASAGVRYDFRDTLTAENQNLYSAATDSFGQFDKSDLGAWNYQLGLSYSIVKDTSVYGTYSRSTRLPTIKDLYSYRLGTAIPNPELDPEKSDNFQVGIKGKPCDMLDLETAGFYYDIHDLMQNNVAITPNQMQNIGHARTVGWEIGAVLHPIEVVDVGATYTLLNRKNLSEPAMELTDTPDNKLEAFLAYRPVRKLEIRPGLDCESGRYTSSDGLRQTDSFVIFNLMVQYELITDMKLQVALNNIADKLYAYQEGYPEAGRTLSMSANYKF